MPSGPRQPTRPGAGPGRSRRRAPGSAGRSPERPATGAAGTGSPSAAAGSRPATPPAAERRRRRSITTRAIALAVVLLVLTISYASSLRVYLAQSADIAATQAEITQRQNAISDLEADLARWDDPAYVRQQARDRFGWVMPGETGYRVVGPDGKPLGGGVEITKPTPPPRAPQAWWQKLWGSVETADRPTPAKKIAKPTVRKPITPKTKPADPSASATPR